MSQYHYTEYSPMDKEDEKEEALAYKEWINTILKQEQCKHKNITPPSGMGFGHCHDCGAIL